MNISSGLKTSIKHLEVSAKNFLQQQRIRTPPRDIAEAWQRDIWRPFKQQVLQERQHIVIQEDNLPYALVDGIPKRLEFITYGWMTDKGRFYKLKSGLCFWDFDPSLYLAKGEVRFTYEPHHFSNSVKDDWLGHPQTQYHRSESHEGWGGTNIFDPARFTLADPLEVDGKELWLLMWLVCTPNQPELKDPDIVRVVDETLRFYFQGYDWDCHPKTSWQKAVC